MVFHHNRYNYPPGEDRSDMFRRIQLFSTIPLQIIFAYGTVITGMTLTSVKKLKKLPEKHMQMVL